LNDSTKSENAKLTNLDSVFVDPALAQGVRRISPSFYQAGRSVLNTISLTRLFRRE